MTQRAITFRNVPGTGERINAETGVIIRKSDDWYLVLCPTHIGYDLITEEKAFAEARYWAIERAELMRENIAEAWTDAAREDSTRMAESEDDDLIHWWSSEIGHLAACGVNIMTTPYTFGSPDRADVTCRACLLVG